MAVFLRLHGIDRGFEYDEIWPLQAFSDRSAVEVLFNRDRPNLHRLHNTLIALTTTNSLANEQTLRIWAFCAGVLTVVVIGLMAQSSSGSKYSGLVAALGAALSPALVHYSQTARGYAFQYLFGLLVFWVITQKEWASRFSLRWLILLLLVSILAILSVVTSIFILVAAYTWYLLSSIPEMRAGSLSIKSWGSKYVLPVLICSSIICIWLIWIWPGLSQGRQYSEAVQFGMNALSVPFDVIMPLFPGSLMPLLFLVSVALTWRISVTQFTCILIVITVVGAYFTGIGPPRVYTYLIPFALVVVGAGVTRMMSAVSVKIRDGQVVRILGFVVIGILFATELSANRHHWRGQLDYKSLVPDLLKSASSKSYLIFDAVDGRCVNFYHGPEVVQNNYLSMVRGNGPAELVLVNIRGSRPSLSAYTLRSNKNVSIPLEPKLVEGEITHNGVTSCRVPIYPVSSQVIPSAGVLLAVVILPIAEFEKWERMAFDEEAREKWFLVNAWLTRAIYVAQNEQSPEKRICAVFCANTDNEFRKYDIQKIFPDKNIRYFGIGVDK